MPMCNLLPSKRTRLFGLTAAFMAPAKLFTVTVPELQVTAWASRSSEVVPALNRPGKARESEPNESNELVFLAFAVHTHCLPDLHGAIGQGLDYLAIPTLKVVSRLKCN